SEPGHPVYGHTEMLSLAHGLPALAVNETQRGTHGWPNLIVHDKVRELVLLRRFAIEDRESCAGTLGEQRKPRRRIDDKRRTENQKEIAAARDLIGTGHFVLGHCLSKRNRCCFDNSAA